MFYYVKALRFSVLFFILVSVNKAYSANSDYIFPFNSISHSNYGGAGLIMNPSARFHEAGTLAVRWSNFDPYIRGSVLAYPFEWFEASYQYTDVNNALYSDIEAFSGDQSYKDKGFDVKFRLLKENQWRPNVALGIRDIAGTGVFGSEFIVFSKYIGNFDFTVGLGWGHLSNNGKYNNPLGKIKSSMYERGVMDANTQGGEVDIDKFFTGPMGVFAGLEYYLPNANGLRFKIEYDGTDYSTEGFPTVESFPFAFEDVRKQQSKINYGLEYPINDYFRLDASFAKGNTLNFGLTVSFPLGSKNSIVKKKNDPPIPVANSEETKIVAAQSDLYLFRTALLNMNPRKVYLQAANRNDDELEVIYAQSTFPSFALSTGRVARILDEVSPPAIKAFRITNINAGLGMNTIQINRGDFNKFKEKNLPKLLKKNTVIEPYKYAENEAEYNPSLNLPKVFWAVEPDLRTQVGGPDGFFFGDLRIKLKTETLFRKNMSLIAIGSVGIYDTFDQLRENPDSILPHVRTDVIPYLKESTKVSIKRIQFNYFANPSKNIYSKLSAGILEEMFGGVGGEILYKPFYKNYGIGAELWRVQQRAYDMRFSFRDYMTTTGHITLYLHEQRSNVLLEIKGGKFLAKDSGIRFDFSRRFSSGLRVGAFFALTDISKEEFGEGSFDKGFYFHVPITLFRDKHVKRKFSWGLRPLTRDGAAYVTHAQHLWGVVEQASYNSITRDWNQIYE